MSSLAAASIKNLNKEIGKYLELKGEASWLSHLIQEKEKEHGSDLDDLKKKQEEIDRRIWKMEENLINSIQEIKTEKEEFLKEAEAKMIEWRRRIHP